MCREFRITIEYISIFRGEITRPDISGHDSPKTESKSGGPAIDSKLEKNKTLSPLLYAEVCATREDNKHKKMVDFSSKNVSLWAQPVLPESTQCAFTDQIIFFPIEALTAPDVVPSSLPEVDFNLLPDELDNLSVYHAEGDRGIIELDGYETKKQPLATDKASTLSTDSSCEEKCYLLAEKGYIESSPAPLSYEEDTSPSLKSDMDIHSANLNRDEDTDGSDSCSDYDAHDFFHDTDFQTLDPSADSGRPRVVLTNKTVQKLDRLF